MRLVPAVPGKNTSSAAEDEFLLASGEAFAYISTTLSGNSSVVERHLAKVDVASSSLVSRSIFFDKDAQRHPFLSRILSEKTGGMKTLTRGVATYILRYIF